jgi:glycogen(starch) synthase
MKVLIHSMVFSPSIGGTETATRLLAIGLNELGHQVKVITDTSEGPSSVDGIEVYRGPSISEYLRLVKWCDIFVHSNISLRNAWPLLVYKRPWVVIHHTRIEAVEGEHTISSRVKQWIAKIPINLTVSKFMSDSLNTPSTVIKNPYADNVYRVDPGVDRNRDLIAVGRFLNDKGFQVAIEALHKLRQRGFTNTRLTLVGDGPYREQLDALTKKLNLQSAVDFTGIKGPEELVKIFNRHKILIVPSLIPETFGLVAIEGMASGCLVIGSNVGSLKQTIGPGGLTFKSGDVDELANYLQTHLEHPEAKEPYLQAAAPHLVQFERALIIPPIADCLEQIVADSRHKA